MNSTLFLEWSFIIRSEHGTVFSQGLGASFIRRPQMMYSKLHLCCSRPQEMCPHLSWPCLFDGRDTQGAFTLRWTPDQSGLFQPLLPCSTSSSLCVAHLIFGSKNQGVRVVTVHPSPSPRCLRPATPPQPQGMQSPLRVPRHPERSHRSLGLTAAGTAFPCSSLGLSKSPTLSCKTHSKQKAGIWFSFSIVCREA